MAPGGRPGTGGRGGREPAGPAGAAGVGFGGASGESFAPASGHGAASGLDNGVPNRGDWTLREEDETWVPIEEGLWARVWALDGCWRSRLWRKGPSQGGLPPPVGDRAVAGAFRIVKSRPRCCSNPPACTPTGLPWLPRDCGSLSKNFRSSRPPCGEAAGTERPGRGRLAGGLERQAAEDGDDPFPEHQRNGLWGWLRLDGGEYRAAGHVPGGYELQAGQPSPDSAWAWRDGPARMGPSGTRASCGSWPIGWPG